MRISAQTSQILLNALKVSDQAEQTALTQLTTGRRVNVSSDDPSSAAMEVNIASQMDGCDQYLRSVSSVSSELNTADSSLNSAVTAIQMAISVGVQGANSTLSQSNRDTLAQEVSGVTQQVLNVANTSYNGTYIFAGTATSQPPYVLDNTAPGGIAYKGNDNVNSVEVNFSQSMVVNQPGSQLFSAPGANVFVALDDLKSALQDPTSTTDDIGTAVTELRAAYDQMNSARTFYGNTLDQLTASADFLNSEKVELAQQQNSTVGVDMNTAATNLTNAEAARTAAVQAAASLSSVSLMDYISTSGG